MYWFLKYLILIKSKKAIWLIFTMLHIIIIVSNQHVKDLHYHFDLHLLTSESELYFLISACGHGDVKSFLCIRYALCAGALTCLWAVLPGLRTSSLKRLLSEKREAVSCLLPILGILRLTSSCFWETDSKFKLQRGRCTWPKASITWISE